MTHPSSATRNRVFVLSGLGVALLIGVFLSPFASENPDGLDRVAQELKFDQKAATFGLAWGVGKLTVRGSRSSDEPSSIK
jgi:cobalt/nickel transport protein